MSAKRILVLRLLFFTTIVLGLPLLRLRTSIGEPAILGRYPVDYAWLTRMYIAVAALLLVFSLTPLFRRLLEWRGQAKVVLTAFGLAACAVVFVRSLILESTLTRLVAWIPPATGALFLVFWNPPRVVLEREQSGRAAKYALVSVSILFCLVVGELFCRSFPPDMRAHTFRGDDVWPAGWYVEDERAGYRISSDFPPTEFTIRGLPSLCYSNPLGMRDVGVPDNDLKRIVVLGDSMTEGFALTGFSDPWPRQLQRYLRRLSSQYEGFWVLNAGVSGYNTFQEIALLEHRLDEWRPDMLILSFYGGIMHRNRFGREGICQLHNGQLILREQSYQYRNLPRLYGDSPLWLKLHDFLLENSGLYQYLRIFWFKLEGRRVHFPMPYEDPHENPLVGLAESLDYVSESSRSATRDALIELRNLAQERALPVQVLYFPSFVDVDGYNEGLGTPAADVLFELCDELGLDYVNPVSELAFQVEAGKARQILTHGADVHYSARGNEIYARVVAPLVDEWLRRVEVSQDSGVPE